MHVGCMILTLHRELVCLRSELRNLENSHDRWFVILKQTQTSVAYLRFQSPSSDWSETAYRLRERQRLLYLEYKRRVDNYVKNIIETEKELLVYKQAKANEVGAVAARSPCYPLDFNFQVARIGGPKTGISLRPEDYHREQQYLVDPDEVLPVEAWFRLHFLGTKFIKRIHAPCHSHGLTRDRMADFIFILVHTHAAINCFRNYSLVRVSKLRIGHVDVHLALQTI
jgi:hypothetical protein